MINGFWGRKVGMTQLFSGDRVVPVTLVDASSWVVVGHKTQGRDGYNALQLACPRKRYQGESFSTSWLKDKKHYFLFVKEVKVNEPVDSFEVGKTIDLSAYFAEGEKLDATGTTKGCGFAGVMRRHNFAGGRGSHGCKQGARPGSISSLRTCGKVFKGKGMPGHMGVDQKTMQNLYVIKILKEQNVLAVKGSIPGKAGSLVFLRKSRGKA